MATTGDFIRSMRAREREGADWAVHLQGMDSAIKLTVPYGTLEALPVIQKPVEAKNDFKEAVARTSPTPAPEVQSPAATTPDQESPATGANSQSTPPPDDDPYKATKLT